MNSLRRSNSKTFGVVLAGLALWCQALLMLVHASTALAALPGPDPSADTKTIVICTGSGMIRVSVDENGQPVETETAVTFEGACDACTSVAGMSFVPPHGAALQSPYTTAIGVSDAAAVTHVTTERVLAPESRGPPLQS